MKKMNYFIIALTIAVLFSTCKSSGNVTEVKNRAVENLTNWQGVMALIDDGKFDKAIFVACLIQQAAKGSDQNLCASFVKSEEREREQDLKERRVKFCTEITLPDAAGKYKMPKIIDGKTSSHWNFTECLQYFSN